METLAGEEKVQMRKFNFEYAIRPIYYFSRLSGLWPFSIVRDSNGKIQRARIGFFDILWPILLICLHLKLSLEYYEDFRATVKNHVIRIRFVVFCILDMTSFLFITIEIVLNGINRNKLVDILGKFDTFGNEVR